MKLSLALLCWIAVGCIHPSVVSSEAGALPATPGDTTLAARIGAFVAPYVDAGLWSGSVAVVIDDSLVHAAGYGFADLEHRVPNAADTRFRVASVTKAFTATAAARLWRAGIVYQDATIDRWLPDFPRGNEITVGQLVRHTSGIPNTDDLPWFALGQRVPLSLSQLVDSLGQAGLRFTPGEDYDYSNGGYAVLAAVLTEATGLDFGEVLERWVFRPAGMARSGDATRLAVIEDLASGYMLGPESILVPGPVVPASSKVGAASAYSTVIDLVAFQRALRDEAFLPEAVRDSLFRPIDSPLGGSRIYLGGRGPSHTAAFQVFPDRKGMVAVLGNNYGRLNEEISDGVAALAHGEWEDARIDSILGRRPLIESVLVEDGPVASDGAAAELAGSYRHAWGFEFSVVEDEGRLVYVDPEHRTRSPVVRTSGDAFLLPWQWARLAKGVGGLTWTWLDFPDRAWPVERVDEADSTAH